MGNMFPPKYTGGCGEWFGKLPVRHHHTHTLGRCCSVADSWTIPGFSVTQQTSQCFSAQSALTLARLLFLPPSILCNSDCSIRMHALHSHITIDSGVSKLRFFSFWYPAQRLCATFALNVSCVCEHMCTCCIQFQRILDSITQPIKDHLFQCANLIWPCTDLTAFLPVSRSIGGPPSATPWQKPGRVVNRAPLTHNVTISRPGPNPADTDIDAPLIALYISAFFNMLRNRKRYQTCSHSSACLSGWLSPCYD